MKVKQGARTVNGKIKYKGVTQVTPYADGQDRYNARIVVRRQLKSLGYFPDPVQAARAYDKAAIELHKNGAKTNVQIGLLEPLPQKKKPTGRSKGKEITIPAREEITEEKLQRMKGELVLPGNKIRILSHSQGEHGTGFKDSTNSEYLNSTVTVHKNEAEIDYIKKLLSGYTPSAISTPSLDVEIETEKNTEVTPKQTLLNESTKELTNVPTARPPALPRKELNPDLVRDRVDATYKHLKGPVLTRRQTN